MEDNQREISNNLFVDQDKVKLLSQIVQQKRLGKLKKLVKSKEILEWIQMNTEIEK